MSPLYHKLKCAQCNCTESLFWKSIGTRQHLCNNCSDGSNKNNKEKQQEIETHRKPDDRRTKLRKSTRSTRYSKNNANTNSASGAVSSNTNKSSTTKSSGRGRRNLFRRPPIKAQTTPATTRYVKSVFHKVSHDAFVYLIAFNLPSDVIRCYCCCCISTGKLHSNRRYCFIVEFKL